MNALVLNSPLKEVIMLLLLIVRGDILLRHDHGDKQTSNLILQEVSNFSQFSADISGNKARKKAGIVTQDRFQNANTELAQPNLQFDPQYYIFFSNRKCNTKHALRLQPFFEMEILLGIFGTHHIGIKIMLP